MVGTDEDTVQILFLPQQYRRKDHHIRRRCLSPEPKKSLAFVPTRIDGAAETASSTHSALGVQPSTSVRSSSHRKHVVSGNPLSGHLTFAPLRLSHALLQWKGQEATSNHVCHSKQDVRRLISLYKASRIWTRCRRFHDWCRAW